MGRTRTGWVWLVALALTGSAEGAPTVSLALFFNLESPEQLQNLRGYQDTTQETIERGFLRLEQSPTTPEFVRGYFEELSYGHLSIALQALQDEQGQPLIPRLPAPQGDPHDWGGLIRAILERHGECAWRQAGASEQEGVRVIPSVVLVQNYAVGASATVRSPIEAEAGGVRYRVERAFHCRPDASLATIIHEYAHNFIEGFDLYGGGGGKIGYWDVLGDNTPPGHASDCYAYYKVRLGWLPGFKAVVEGPTAPEQEFVLRPYGRTGDALKIVPDPVWNPSEFFLLEYRCPPPDPKPWTPDGGLVADGLLITHFNERLGEAPADIAMDSPFADIEEADGNDGRCWDPSGRGYCSLTWQDPWDWVGAAARGAPGLSAYPPNNWPSWDRPAGVLFPFNGRDAFTPETDPNSDFYGGRPSGLYVTEIRRVPEGIAFRVRLAGCTQAGWEIGPQDRATAGDWDGDGDADVYLWNGRAATVLESQQNQMLQVWQIQEGDPGWPSGSLTQVIPADYTGDGRLDWLLVGSEGAALLFATGSGFQSVPLPSFTLTGWQPKPADHWLAVKLDEDPRWDLLVWGGGRIGWLRSTGTSFVPMGSGSQASSDSGQMVIADLEGDRCPELVLVGSEGLDVLRLGLEALELLQHAAGEAAGWRLPGTTAALAADFDGNGKQELLLRAYRSAALLSWTGAGWSGLWSAHGSVGDCPLDPEDRLQVGDVNRDGVPDLILKGPSRVGFLTWREGAFHLLGQREGRIGGWALGGHDQVAAGDLNGDGYTDLWVWNQEWAGTLLTWRHPQEKETVAPAHGWIAHQRIASKRTKAADAPPAAGQRRDATH